MHISKLSFKFFDKIIVNTIYREHLIRINDILIA